jgi:dTMP kinase
MKRGNVLAEDRGKLITFEGIDGCGKTTQLECAAERMRARGVSVVTTRQPTDGPMGRRIRAMAQSNERVAPETELEWFMEDRREHAREVIEPAIARGDTILCDRYFLSSVAYQGARGLDADEILSANEREFRMPDLALIFEISADAAMARVTARGGVAEPAFEDVAFLRRAEKIYAGLEREYIRRIDATGDVDAVERLVVELLG